MSADQNRKLSWFNEGAASLRACYERRGEPDFLDPGDWYGCPLCLYTFSREAVAAGELTAEDVPPRSVGGRKILLTCKACNNTSGEQVDVHAASRQMVMDFARGKETGRPLRATLDADGVPMRGTVQWNDGTLQMFGVPRQNDPRVSAEHFRRLDTYVDARLSNPPVSIKVDLPRFDGTVANLAYIRAAYLVGFAIFGWPYVINPIMDELREQFRNPDHQMVPVFVNIDANEPDDARQILLAEEPSELACLAVTMGPWTIFLPSPYRFISLAALAESFDRYKVAGQRPMLNGKLIPWPTRAEYGLP